jgi:uncharacterized protein
MRIFFVAFTSALFAFSAALAASPFPALTGRVVDDAQLLSDVTKRQLVQQIEAHEKATTNQMVVVTLSSLQGLTIEEFGYALGRHWGIGQKGKNNGVLLLVAPGERAVRIEVGYGLEGTLTDAISNQIIQTIILPEFKRGEMEQGIYNGSGAIISVLNGQPLAEVAHKRMPAYIIIPTILLMLILFASPFVVIFMLIRRLTRSPHVSLTYPVSDSDNRRSGGGSSNNGSSRSVNRGSSGGGSSGGGGSRGGGGRFGGGGSSGKW